MNFKPNTWYRTVKKLPSKDVGTQIHVLMYNANWANWLPGMFECMEVGNYSWYIYNTKDDRFDYELHKNDHPTHWMVPKPPKYKYF